jgi:hypothetical protein
MFGSALRPGDTRLVDFGHFEPMRLARRVGRRALGKGESADFLHVEVFVGEPSREAYPDLWARLDRLVRHFRAEGVQVTTSPMRRRLGKPVEKGVDTALAMAATRMGYLELVDLMIIVSRDSDLLPLAREFPVGLDQPAAHFAGFWSPEPMVQLGRAAVPAEPTLGGVPFYRLDLDEFRRVRRDGLDLIRDTRPPLWVVEAGEEWEEPDLSEGWTPVLDAERAQRVEDLRRERAERRLAMNRVVAVAPSAPVGAECYSGDDDEPSASRPTAIVVVPRKLPQDRPGYSPRHGEVDASKGVAGDDCLEEVAPPPAEAASRVVDRAASRARRQAKRKRWRWLRRLRQRLRGIGLHRQGRQSVVPARPRLAVDPLAEALWRGEAVLPLRRSRWNRFTDLRRLVVLQGGDGAVRIAAASTVATSVTRPEPRQATPAARPRIGGPPVNSRRGPKAGRFVRRRHR